MMQRARRRQRRGDVEQRGSNGSRAGATGAEWGAVGCAGWMFDGRPGGGHGCKWERGEMMAMWRGWRSGSGEFWVRAGRVLLG